MKKTIVLLSGGLDSLTLLALMQSKQYQIHCLSFDYGQKHIAELNMTQKIISKYKPYKHQVVKINLRQFGGSSLTDDAFKVENSDLPRKTIPSTYVPARNIIFLSLALAYADVHAISEIAIGVNYLDYSGYPDCRPEFIDAFSNMANLGTRIAVEQHPVTIHTPFIAMSKKEIIEIGMKLGVNYSLSVSCYRADKDGKACGECDACILRKNGFKQAGIIDPTIYQE